MYNNSLEKIFNSISVAVIVSTILYGFSWGESRKVGRGFSDYLYYAATAVQLYAALLLGSIWFVQGLFKGIGT